MTWVEMVGVGGETAPQRWWMLEQGLWMEMEGRLDAWLWYVSDIYLLHPSTGTGRRLLSGNQKCSTKSAVIKFRLKWKKWTKWFSGVGLYRWNLTKSQVEKSPNVRLHLLCTQWKPSCCPPASQRAGWSIHTSVFFQTQAECWVEWDEAGTLPAPSWLVFWLALLEAECPGCVLGTLQVPVLLPLLPARRGWPCPLWIGALARRTWSGQDWSWVGDFG